MYTTYTQPNFAQPLTNKQQFATLQEAEAHAIEEMRGPANVNRYNDGNVLTLASYKNNVVVHIVVAETAD